MRTIYFFLVSMLVSSGSYAQSGSNSSHDTLQVNNVSLLLQGSATKLYKFCNKEIKTAQNMSRAQDIKSYVNTINNCITNYPADQEYLIALNDYITYVDSITSDKNSPDSVKQQMLTILYEDIQLKTQKIAGMGAQTAIIYKVPVVVKTVKMVNNQYVDQNGYKVHCNPWLCRNNEQAAYDFNNPTSPTTADELPPGYYDFWVESPSGKMPKIRSKKKIAVTSSTPVEIILEVQ